jgi:AraC-like DNA-binding protein
LLATTGLPPPACHHRLADTALRTKLTETDLWPVPVQVLGRLVEELRAQGIRPQDLYRAFGPLEALLGQPEAVLPYGETVAIVERALSVVADDAGLGLQVGRRVRLTDWGVVGYAAICCSTLGEAMRLAPRYYRVAPSLTMLELQETDDAVLLIATLPRPLGRVGRFAVEEDFSGILQVAASLTGCAVPLREVRFAYPEPADRTPYERCFACPIVFGAERNLIVFDPATLQLPLLYASPFSMATATMLCDQFLQKHPTESDLAVRVRHLLIESGLRLRHEDELAGRLCLSPRTLRRQLAASGQTFQRILDSAREQLACRMLSSSSLKIEDVAERLGYSDARTFRRAFKQWVGKTPTEWRVGS